MCVLSKSELSGFGAAQFALIWGSTEGMKKVLSGL